MQYNHILDKLFNNDLGQLSAEERSNFISELKWAIRLIHGKLLTTTDMVETHKKDLLTKSKEIEQLNNKIISLEIKLDKIMNKKLSFLERLKGKLKQ